MLAVVCRVESASVEVGGDVVGRVERGLLAYVAVVEGDWDPQARWLADKLVTLRLFNDEEGRLNLCLRDVGGGLLLIPNFTLAGRTRKGARPSFTDAADPAVASPLFDVLVSRCAEHVRTAAGLFGAHMRIDARFDGPVTVIVESP